MYFLLKASQKLNKIIRVQNCDFIFISINDTVVTQFQLTALCSERSRV